VTTTVKRKGKKKGALAKKANVKNDLSHSWKKHLRITKAGREGIISPCEFEKPGEQFC